MILLTKLEKKENKKFMIKVGAWVGSGIATAIIGGGIGGLIYFGVAGTTAAAGAARTAGAIAVGEVATGAAVPAGAASAAGTAGATGSILIANSIENLQAKNPYKFGFITLFSILTQIDSGAYLINDNANKNYYQDNSERDNTQTLKIKEFKVKNSLDKWKIKFIR